MSNNIKWRFPSNGYAATTGLDTADLETFKSDINASLAREITQNSIDAKDQTKSLPVKIEFKTFKIRKDEIPGYNDLILNINYCIDYWQEFGSEKTVNALQEMLKELNRDQITCLRVSDFNTTGLVGISKMENTPWHNLIHGSGVSEKSSTSGGSKGIGKFATFVNSHFRTVFYSTKTIDNEVGYEGVCKLCSGNIPGTDEKTQGIGYFGSNDKNMPIFENLNLDSSFKRNNKDYGTDIFILGFKIEDNWKEEIICKVLDSFISAIIYNSLQVVVDNVLINKETLEKIVHDSNIVRTKQQRQKILSQYLLLTDPNTHVETINVSNFGDVKLYVRLFNDHEKDIATNKCTMIRYPYMKIKDHPIQSLVKVSALCIIPDNRLNEELRKIENPQHIDWEFNRIENVVLRNDFKNKISNLFKTISEIITKVTLKQSETMTELEGSEQFISRIEEEKEIDHRKLMKETEDLKTTTLYRPKIKINLDKKYDTSMENMIPELGQTDPIDTEKKPIKDKEKNDKEKNDNTYKKTELRSFIFKFMCIDKSLNKYLVSFESDVTEDDCEIIIAAQDEGNYTIPIEITNCFVNNLPSQVEENRSIHLKLKKGSKYNIVFTTTETELFACWIKAYAYKK